MPKKLKQKFFKAASGEIGSNSLSSINQKVLFIGGSVEGPTATDFKGNSRTISEQDQLLIAGLDHCGKQKFYKTTGGDNSSSEIGSLSSNKKRVFLTGFIGSTGFDFDNQPLNNQSQEIFVAGLDNCGNQKFFKTAGGESDSDRGFKIVSNNKAAFLTGTVFGPNIRDFNNQMIPAYGFFDIFVAAVDNCGNQKFFKSTGSVNSDLGLDITLNKKRVFVTGAINGPTATDFSGQPVVGLQGTSDIFVAGLDHYGNQKFFKVAGSDSTDIGSSITSNDKNIFVAGSIRGLTAANFDSNVIDNVNGVSANIFVAGLNNCGQQKFFKIAGSDFNDSVNKITHDNKGIYLTGTLGSPSVTGFDGQPISNINNFNEIYVAGLDLCGNQKFFKTAGGAGVDTGLNIISNGSHLFVTGGLFNSGTATDFNGKVIQLKGNSSEIFVAVLDNKSGCQKAFLTAGGTGFDRGIGLTIKDDMVFVSGNLEGDYDFNGKTIERPNGEAIFVARLDDLMPKKVKPFRTKNPYYYNS